MANWITGATIASAVAMSSPTQTLADPTVGFGVTFVFGQGVGIGVKVF